MPWPLPIDDGCVLYADVLNTPEARHHLVRCFLADRFGREWVDVRLAKTAAGRPVVETHDEISVSWSHREGFLLIGVAKSRLGVDLETVDRAFPADEVVAAFFGREERRLFHALAPGARMSAFYLLWTLREAYLKALGVGLDALVGRELDFSAVVRGARVPETVAATIHGPRLGHARMLSRLVYRKGRWLRVAKIEEE